MQGFYAPFRRHAKCESEWMESINMMVLVMTRKTTKTGLCFIILSLSSACIMSYETYLGVETSAAVVPTRMQIVFHVALDSVTNCPGFKNIIEWGISTDKKKNHESIWTMMRLKGFQASSCFGDLEWDLRPCGISPRVSLDVTTEPE